MYDKHISKIKSLQFGLLSPEEIRNESVTEITKHQSFRADGAPIPGGLFDSRMSPSEKDERCETDNLPYDITPGYFGKIELNLPIFHHFHINTIQQVLSVICIECGSLVNPPFNNTKNFSGYDLLSFSKNNHPSEIKLLNLPKKQRLLALKKIKSDNRICPVCSCKQPKKYTTNLRGVDTIDAVYSTTDDIENKSIFPEYVYRLFQKINDKTCELMGFNPEFSHPSSLILHTIPVCPPLVRPSVKQGNGNMARDHITIRYEEVMKSNLTIRGYLNKDQHKEREKFREYLAHDVATLIDNDPGGGFSSMPRGSTQPHQTFGQRLRGKVPKAGRIRGNLLSRRVEMSGRSVITPDPMIELDEIGVPKKIAKKITYPVKVTEENRYFLEKCIENGPNVYPGAVGLIRKLTTNVIKPRKGLLLQRGDIVMRHIINGDYVLMNRLPTLHKKGFMGHKVRVMEGYSFRLNVNSTEPYNADFDGDEMNLHCPQNITTISETIELAGLKNQCMSSASNSPSIAFVQDNVLSAHMMTQNKHPFSNRELMNILARGAPHYYGNINKKKYSGKEIFNFYTPDYSDSVNKTLNKKDLIQIVSRCYHELGNNKCFEMTGMLQKLLNEYFLHHSFSIGPKDLKRGTDVHKKIDEIVDKMIMNITKRIENIHNSVGPCDKISFENFVNSEIGKATLKSENLLSKDEQSRFKPMIECGSKGKKKNITQMKGFLGQQIVNGKRTNTGYTHRTLPHFHKYCEDIRTRGFIRNSLSKGLHPFEFFFHAGGGREGLIEQALGTGDSGYIQRQMVKTLEDMVVKWSNTVNDAQNNIVQFLFGEDGAMGESIEEQDLIKIFNSLSDLELEYSLTKNEEHLNACINSQILKTIPQDKVLFEKYFNDFIEIRNDFIDTLCNKQIHSQEDLITTCNHSVNISQKVKFIINKFSLSNSIKTDLDPTTILKTYSDLFDRCSLHKYYSGCTLFKLLIYTHASPKQLICQYRFTREAFKEFVLNIEKSYKYSRIEPGEAVGVIAAQSIGEPCTQLTLNSFHFAGAGRSQGVPRLKELMYLESSATGRKLSISSIYLNRPHSIIETDTIKILKEIECIRFKDVLKSYTFHFDSPHYPWQNETLQRYHYLEEQAGVNDSVMYQWILRFFINEDKASLIDVWRTINEQEWVNNPIIDPETKSIFFRIDVYSVTKTDNNMKIVPVAKKGEAQKDFEVSLIGDIVEYGIEPLIIQGISGITNASYNLITSYRRDPDIGEVHEQKSYMISASGSELQEILSNPAVDTTRTCSNNVIDMYETFGIEAARLVLIEELSLVLKDVAHLDKRHISLLVDRMIATGKLLSVNMLGMDGYQNGPLTKASFERISKELLKAGVNGDIENVTGLASNIIVGQAPPCGTGIVNVSIDEDMYNNVKFDKVEKTKDSKLSTKPKNMKIHTLIDFSID